MVSHARAEELIRSLVKKGECLDPRDLTLFYGWVYSSYLSLEPFPSVHVRFGRRCLDKFDAPDRKLKIGLCLMKSALQRIENGADIPDSMLSKDYLSLLDRFSQFGPTPND